MSPFDSARATASGFPLQFLDIRITPLVVGVSITMGATLLNEDSLEFIGQDLASERVDTLDQALAVIASNLRASAASLQGSAL